MLSTSCLSEWRPTWDAPFSSRDRSTWRGKARDSPPHYPVELQHQQPIRCELVDVGKKRFSTVQIEWCGGRK